MVRTRECEFCGDDIEPGTGTMFVHVDGTTEHFCSSKCERSTELGREPRDVGWTEAGRQTAAANRKAEEAQRAEAATEADAESAASEDAESETGTAEADEEGDTAEAEADGDTETEEEQEV